MLRRACGIALVMLFPAGAASVAQTASDVRLQDVTVTTQAMNDATRRISRYFSLQLLINFMYGCLIWGALYLIGLPHALLFGSLATLFRFVPYVGSPVAALLPTLLSLAVFHGWTRTATIVGIFMVLELFTANYAEPHIYGKHTGLSSLAILVAAAFWTLRKKPFFHPALLRPLGRSL